MIREPIGKISTFKPILVLKVVHIMHEVAARLHNRLGFCSRFLYLYLN